jgi:post-segregation antitoxin (ccd killing protein)
MPINTLAMATLFQTALDRQMIEGATSGWMEDNAGEVKYSGGNTVKIPKISMDGLANYDRDLGYVQGGVTLAYGTYTMTQDRGRKFQLDAMDVDESNFVATAGNVMGEFQRTKVIPEVDAYRYSKLSALAIAAGNTGIYVPAVGTILNQLKTDLVTIQDVIGGSESLVVTMSRLVYAILAQSSQVTRFLDAVNFKQGDVNLEVKSIDGTPIIPVPSARLKTAYVFNDGKTTGQTVGGFVPASGAKQINYIISARKAPIAVSKTDTMKIFDPITNQTAQAWLIEYRKFHELWVADNTLTGTFASTAS